MRAAARLLVTALVVLGAAWSIAPRSAPPLYDGLGFPDEPYRFVARPAGTNATDPPTTAIGEVTFYGAQTYPLTASSAEIAPQVNLTYPPDSIRPPATTNRVSVVARPTAPLPAAPGQFLWSNVYTVTTSPAITVTAGHSGVLTLRSATAQRPRPTIARYDGGRHWTPLPTVPVGRDIYSAHVSATGRYAVLGSAALDLRSLGARDRGSAGSWIGRASGLGVLTIVVVMFLLGLRRRKNSRVAAEVVGTATSPGRPPD